jgi:sterol-4alpha-carboxylate 3-dehydrogenase (decarboxylating)
MLHDTSTQASRYLVVGGAGFLGQYIVQALVRRGASHVAVFDIVEPEQKVDGIRYYSGDICDQPRLETVLREVCLTIFIPRTF